MRVRSGLSLPTFAAVGLVGVNAMADGLYLEAAHASNARVTDRDLGRNFLQVGWSFPNGTIVSGGAYLSGEKQCFESLTVGQAFRQRRWQATLTAHAGGICSIDSRRVPFHPNVGLCTTRLLTIRSRWSAGLGGCVWRYADFAIGDDDPNSPSLVEDDRGQLTAHLLLRFALTRKD